MEFNKCVSSYVDVENLGVTMAMESVKQWKSLEQLRDWIADMGSKKPATRLLEFLSLSTCLVGRHQHFLGWLHSHGAWGKHLICKSWSYLKNVKDQLHVGESCFDFLKFDPENWKVKMMPFWRSCFVVFFKWLLQSFIEIPPNATPPQEIGLF